MPAPRSSAPRLRTARRQQARAARRARRIAGLTVIGVVLVVGLLLTAFGPDQSRVLQPLAEASSLPTTSRPPPEIVALKDGLRLQLPVARPTALGFHAAGDGAVSLTPVGHQGNEGGLAHLFHKLFGGGGGGPTWYQLGGGGPSNSALDVGAAPGTDVYAPVDGTVVGVTPYVLDGRQYGVELDVQPQTTPSFVVAVVHLSPDPSIKVGAPVVSGVTKIGTVIDLSSVEHQALARFTQDAGNNVSLEVRPAATLAPS
jgi:murein DD-endopeptidase MepM/ murein hydrolase activator NlpD